jgi:membrane fusion protein
MTHQLRDVPYLPSAPPIWAARGLAWVLLAIFGAAAVALAIVHVPETVPAPFVLVAVKGSDPIRALHAGVVTGVHVADAQRVAAGAALFTLRSEAVGDRTAERDALGASLAGGQARQANERERYAQQRRADEQDVTRLTARIAALETQIAIKERQASLAREVAARTQRSYDRGLTSWMDTTASRLEADRLAADVEQARADLASTRSELDRLRFQMGARRAEFDELTRRVGEEIDRTRTRKGMLDREGPSDAHALMLSAPCEGTVVGLLARTAGTVVAEGEVLAEIACTGERLQVELQVPQRGLAVVAPGQAVRLRYDAFPYERYGVRSARLRWMSPAAAPGSADGAFRALADLDEASVQAGGRDRPVLPGMRGDASIVVGRRSLASYVFAPLRRLREDVAGGSGGRP